MKKDALIATQVLVVCDVLYCAMPWSILTLATILADLISGHVQWLSDAYAIFLCRFVL